MRKLLEFELGIDEIVNEYEKYCREVIVYKYINDNPDVAVGITR